jgi:hypothetical protein
VPRVAQRAETEFNADMNSWLHRVSILCALPWLGCANPSTPKNVCPATVAVGQTINCVCSEGGGGTQTCQPNSLLSPCVCTTGNVAADGGKGSAGNNAGTGATGGSTNLTDASEQPLDASIADASADSGGTRPPTDGTQGTACGPQDVCAGNLTCYAPNAAAVGICTAPCAGGDTTCSSISGGNYTCSSNAPLTMGYCTQKCGASGDSSCPLHMKCQETAPATATSPAVHECLYEPKSLGGGDVAQWEQCDTARDCKADLVCFGRGTMMIAGTTYKGFCTQPCMDTSQCTTQPPSGSIAPTCGTDDKCMLNCAGGATCPTGMTCIVDIGLSGARRCVYTQ